MKKIVITGAGGNMGKAITQGLRQYEEYNVVAAAHHPQPERNEVYLDMTDLQSCVEAFTGAYAVVHLAGLTRIRINSFLEDAMPVNIGGTYTIYEAARLCGVKKVIFGSTNHVFGMYRADEQVGDDAEYRPDSLYGLSKCCAEVIGRFYSDFFNISCFNVRIGHCRGIRTGENNFVPGVREYNQLLSNRDAVQLMRCCIEADESIKYMAFPGTSGNSDNYWDISKLKDAIGYVPEDDGSAMITPETPKNETEFRGGAFCDITRKMYN